MKSKVKVIRESARLEKPKSTSKSETMMNALKLICGK